MVNVIKNFCNNENVKNGILLIDMPTGSGKTYKVLEYIFDKVSSRSDTKIFFITSLKKNLPENELKEYFEKNGRLDLYEEKFLRLKSNIDMLTENWGKSQKYIPDNIRIDDRYKNIDDILQYINAYGNSPFISKLKDDLRIKYEPDFRCYIENILAKEYSQPQQRLEAIEKDKKWQWVGKLYPTVFTNKFQIYFLSMNKFLAMNSTITEPSYAFLNSPIIENSIIFIDEFDATKETALMNIIENSLKNKIDYINLFKRIHSSLTTHTFPGILSESKVLAEYIEQLIKISEIIHRKYSLNYSYKISFSQDRRRNNFLFHDNQYHTITDNSRAKWILARKDEKTRQCRINFSKEKPSDDDIKILQMLSELRGYISYFQNAVRIIADNFREHKNNNQNGSSEEFSREAAINSVLAEFGFKSNSEEHKFLRNGILVPKRNKVTRNFSNFTNIPYDFYNEGFRYYDFIESCDHDFQSRILLDSFQDTPEKLIIQLSKKAKVIGISATATIKTVTGNYDIDYFESEVGKLKSEADKAELDSYFNEQIKEYDKVNIRAEFISGGSADINCWTDILGDEEFAQAVISKIEQSTPNIYNMQRYVRIAKAFKEFLRHDDIKSFLCMLNKHPRANDSALDKELLEDVIFKYIRYNMPEKQFNGVVYIDGDSYDSKKNDLTNRLAKSEKLFVISVYQTIGAGQNLQYMIPRGVETVSINNYGNTKKDFDAVYVDKPTNLLVQLDNTLSEKNFAKYIFQVEFLRFHHLNNEISSSTARNCITNAFKCFTSQNNYKPVQAENLYNCESIKLHEIKTVIQAIGRICRTGNKNRNIYVYADEALKNSVDKNLLGNERLYNPEFRALLDKADLLRTKRTECDNKNIFGNKASHAFEISNAFIHSYFNKEWNEKRIDEWRRLRDFVLKYPTLSEEQYKSDSINDICIARKIYIELPEKSNKYWYSEKDDYESGEVHFEEKYQRDREVSANDARLHQLMEIPGMREFFNQNGWATEFSANKYMVSPPLFNNIYKGALGEIIGRYIFEQYYQIKLFEIDNPDEFELFDYKTADDVYIDFKHWKESNQFSRMEEREKIKRKLEKCNGNKVIIANIIAKENNYHVSRHHNILEVPCLYDVSSGSINYNIWGKIRDFISDTDK